MIHVKTASFKFLHFFWHLLTATKFEPDPQKGSAPALPKKKKRKGCALSGSSMLNAVGLQADLDLIKHSQAEKSLKLVYIKCLIRHSDLNHQVLKQFCFS